jgi:hypothetical protein
MVNLKVDGVERTFDGDPNMPSCSDKIAKCAHRRPFL